MSAILRQIKGPGQHGSVAVAHTPVVVGRSPRCDLQVADMNLSRRHFQVAFDPQSGHYVITDLQSRNGTFVEGQSAAQRDNGISFPLEGQTEIVAGGCSFILDATPSGEDKPARNTTSFQALERTPSMVLQSNMGRRLQALHRGLHAALTEPVQSQVIADLMELLFASSPELSGVRLDLVDEGGALRLEGKRSRGSGLPTLPAGLLEHVLEDNEVRLLLPGHKDKQGVCVPVRSAQGEMAGTLFIVLPTTLDNDEVEELLSHLTGFSDLFGLALSNARMTSRVAQEMTLRKRLQQHLGPEVVDRLRREDEPVLGGTQETITVLSTRILEFGELCEVLPVEEVFDIASTIHSEMTAIVLEHHGTLDKYFGDGLMAIFGAPIPFEDHALMAVRAARRMQLEMDELNSEFHLMGRPALRLGIALNSGPALVGTLGSKERMQYTAIGHMVNEASVLLNLTGQLDRPILAGKATVDATAGRFTTGKIDAQSVPGAALSTDIYWIDAFGEEHRD